MSCVYFELGISAPWVLISPGLQSEHPLVTYHLWYYVNLLHLTEFHCFSSWFYNLVKGWKGDDDINLALRFCVRPVHN